jgi:hypothetical protein
MKAAVVLAIVFFLLWAAGADAGELPDNFSYTIIKEGKRVGQTTTNVEIKDGICVFSSVTEVEFGEFALDVTTVTEMDAETFTARKFSYQGIRNEKLVEGEFVIEDKTIEGWTQENEFKTPYSYVSQFPGVLMLEDYVICHEAMIANAFMAGDNDPARFGLLMPSAGHTSFIEIAKGSVSSLESEISEAICTKLVVSVSGSSPFASYFDPERSLPVYIAFPAALVEVFLDDFWGDAPVSRYRENP